MRYAVLCSVLLLMAVVALVAACADDDDDDVVADDDSDDNTPDEADATCVAAYEQIYLTCGMSFPDHTMEEMIDGNCYGSLDPIFGVDGLIIQCYQADPTCEALIACVASLFD